jgi:hypothetical protein
MRGSLLRVVLDSTGNQARESSLGVTEAQIADPQGEDLKVLRPLAQGNV